METPTGPSSLVYPTTSYQEYFARSETDTFCERYSAVMTPYYIDPTTAAAAAAAPANVARLIKAAAQESVPTALLQCNQGPRGRGAQITLLHSVSNYDPRMGIMALPWDNSSFDLKGDITCGTIACANWPPASLHQIGSMVHAPTDLAIDTALDADPDSNLLGPFSYIDANLEPLCIRMTVYLPAPFVGIFPEWYLMPMEAWTRLHVTIVEVGLKVDCCHIINWLCVSLTLKTGDKK